MAIDVTHGGLRRVIADEQQATAIGLMSRALAWFNGQGIERDAVFLVVVNGR